MTAAATVALLPVLFDIVDEAIGAGVVTSGGCGLTQFWLDNLSQLLA